MRPGKVQRTRPPVDPAPAPTRPSGGARGRVFGRPVWTAVLLAIALGGGWNSVPARQDMMKAEVILRGQVFRVDVADTPAQQAKGLGGRKFLGPNEGMIFLYNEKSRHSFWMKGMRIPIDMIWLDNRRVVYIEHNVPPPTAGMTEADLLTYRPDEPANIVLEIAAGRARALGLQVGDRVRFRFNVR